MRYSNIRSAIILGFLISLIFQSESLYSQIMSAGNQADSAESNTITISTDKYVNVYIFRGEANLNHNSDFGNFSLYQLYVGNAFKSTSISFRDDQSLAFLYSVPLNSSFDLTSNFNWLYSSDTRTIDLNKVERLNGSLGLRLNMLDDSHFEIRTGYESNIQMGSLSSGSLYGFGGILEPITIDQYTFISTVNGEFINLSNDRQNSNISLNLNVFGNYDEDSRILLNVLYRYSNSANFLPGSFGQSDILLNVENRMKNHIVADLGINFKIWLFNTELRLFASDRYEDKYYNKYLTNSPVTGINRQNHELQLSFNAGINYKNEWTIQNLGILFDLRNETFGIENKFNIQTDEERLLRDIENQKDNITSITRLLYSNSIQITDYDSLRGSLSITLTQFDTPSERNFDDYDKYMLLANLNYSRYVSKFLNAGVLFETQQIHLVNLKSKQSAFNNWYRSLRLSPYIEYKIGGLSMSPRFEVLANYTIYDFENISPNISSISFRQIGYRDSINIIFTDKLSINSRIIINYNERGTLYWKEFSETPQKNNLEQFIKVLFFWKFSDRFRIGFGGRYYNLVQKNLINITGTGGFISRTYGPEMYLQALVMKDSEIRFEGWGDIQAQSSINKITPNFYLITLIRL